MGKFDGIFIVSDMDGTFLGNGGRVVRENIDAIEYFKSEGGLFTAASGRAFYILLPMDSVKKCLNAPAVLSNGACFYDFSDNKTIDGVFLDAKTVSDTLCFIRRNHPTVGLIANSDRGILTDLIVHGIGDYPSAIGEDMFHVRPVGAWETDTDGVFKIVVRGEPDELDTIREELSERFPETYEFAKSCATFLEMQTLGITKAVRVAELKDLLQRKRGQKLKLFACGDYENDIDMLKMADVAVCPENAIPEVKEISDMCLCHCDKGLIADLIKALDNDPKLREI